MAIRSVLSPLAVSAVDWSAIRTELHIDEPFSPEVVAEAEKSAATELSGPKSDLPFFTIDPEGSMDLDQAMFLERNADGYRVHYAIADVAAWVKPGGALDTTCHKRVETFYSPDIAVPLHPFVLSSGVASLLQGQWAPAVVWRIELSADGTTTSATAERALVRSQKRFDYASAGLALEADDTGLQLLQEIGEKRRALAAARGAIDLGTAQQIVSVDQKGLPQLSYRASLPVELWNEQISLLTGMAAADMMLKAKVGLLRTLPTADDSTVAALGRTALGAGG